MLQSVVDAGKRCTNIEVIPVVECNNCGFISGSIVKAIKTAATSRGCRYTMPYTKDKFPMSIVEHIGVLTTEDNKMAALVNLYTDMVEGRITIPARCVTIGQIHQKSYQTPTLQEAIDTVKVGLKNFKRDIKGKLSGKTSNSEDDAAYAFAFTRYWMKLIALQRSVLQHRPGESAGAALP